MSILRVVPELICQDIEVTKRFYVEVFGFEIKYERQNEQFVYFTLDGVDIMAEGISSISRPWMVGEMERPFGRGVNFQWDVSDIEAIYSRVKANAAEMIYLDMEIAEYLCGDVVVAQKQFIVQDPDGYLFRFCAESSNT